MDSLWDAEGNIDASRLHDLGTADIKDLLRRGQIRFVVANVGAPLDWIPRQEAFDFWTTEVEPHITDPSAGAFYLDDYPDEYAYCASLWQSAEDPIVLLERHH